MKLRIREVDGFFVVQTRRFFRWVSLPTASHFYEYRYLMWDRHFVVIYGSREKAIHEMRMYDLISN